MGLLLDLYWLDRFPFEERQKVRHSVQPLLLLPCSMSNSQKFNIIHMAGCEFFALKWILWRVKFSINECIAIDRIHKIHEIQQLIPKTFGNRKRDCAWGCARRINTISENLQIEKLKSGRRSFRSPDWFVLVDLQIFWGGVYPPSATSRTISFSISNSFWY